jgi:coenzyme Q-binding protein COQ10
MRAARQAKLAKVAAADARAFVKSGGCPTAPSRCSIWSPMSALWRVPALGGRHAGASDSETEMVADMLVGFNALREKFTSRVIKTGRAGSRSIYTSTDRCAISTMCGSSARSPVAARSSFMVDFTFRNAMFEKLAGQYFDRAFRKMVAAFEDRAEQLYGSNSSSATSAA